MRYRRRDARHPLVIGGMASMVVVSFSQLLFGPVSSMVRDMAHWSQLGFAILLLLSSLACLLSALVGREPLGAKIERAGMFGCGVALLLYSVNLPSSVASWNTTMGLWCAGTGFACIVRAGIVWRMIRHRETW